MGKHAYLIMAHNNFSILGKLIRLLDFDKNDIYIHVDRKVTDFDQNLFINIPKKSKIYFSDRIHVNWGGYTQVKCELLLLEMAFKNDNYDYYHLLSGVDLPIKNQKFIHEFFELNSGMEFVGFISEWDNTRIKYYYIFNEIGRKKGILPYIQKIINKIFILTQKLVKMDRSKKNKYAKGSNWFSITGDLVKLILDNKNRIRKLYRSSVFCDEVFLQTLIVNSKFKEKIYRFSVSGNLRYIDWKRGNPYIFQKKDFESLINSNMLFARKFDEKVDFEIVNMIYDEFLLKNKQVNS
ncbi:glycosyl transferase [Terrilactibacillus sp. BCM23-1]|uniref:Peptide O-xylosyltransferase n=1 Tax=Terrilactibacillus tamarindi TaxID=2599694 RepID=A0A6N8CPR2_9BACI|nr:beta-1,6-N-acetylglucosaminyltransferase [Terrilactibacillus tamarindi]MTT32164.1 glycosyl transferase [Terrilactibacillus tamarindi]